VAVTARSEARFLPHEPRFGCAHSKSLLTEVRWDKVVKQNIASPGCPPQILGAISFVPERRGRGGGSCIAPANAPRKSAPSVARSVYHNQLGQVGSGKTVATANVAQTNPRSGPFTCEAQIPGENPCLLWRAAPPLKMGTGLIKNQTRALR